MIGLYFFKFCSHVISYKYKEVITYKKNKKNFIKDNKKFNDNYYTKMILKSTKLLLKYLRLLLLIIFIMMEYNVN